MYMNQKVICVCGPSGGVGKSTVTKELAIAFSATKVNGVNVKTCIVDANLIFGTQKSFFSIVKQPTIEDWVTELRVSMRNLSNDEIVARYDWAQIERYLFYSPKHNLHILPAPSRGNYFEIFQEEFDIMIYALKKYFDVIVIDTGNNLEAVTIAAMKIADDVLVMVTDESRTLDSARRLRARVREHNIPINKFRVVFNKCPLRHSERLFSKKEVEEQLLIPVIITLPYNKDTWKLNNAQIPIISDKKKSKLKKRLLQLAHSLIPEVSIRSF